MWYDQLWPFGFIIVWFLLMRFILPALGIPTCMSGACQLRRDESKEKDTHVSE